MFRTRQRFTNAAAGSWMIMCRTHAERFVMPKHKKTTARLSSFNGIGAASATMYACCVRMLPRRAIQSIGRTKLPQPDSAPFKCTDCIVSLQRNAVSMSLLQSCYIFAPKNFCRYAAADVRSFLFWVWHLSICEFAKPQANELSLGLMAMAASVLAQFRTLCRE